MKAAVEQEALFPNQPCFEDYLMHMRQNNRPCEVLSTIKNPDGTLIALLRKGYNPGNIFLSEADRMDLRKTSELTREDIRIDPDIQVDDTGRIIIVYIETWFDVDQKFGTNTEDDDTWLNMYGFYNPYEETLRIECVVNSADREERCFGYTPTESEASLIKSLIEDKIQKCYHQTPKEYCEAAIQN